jgi:hypothetical protein
MLVDLALVGQRERRLSAGDAIHEVPAVPRILTEAPPSGTAEAGIAKL